MRFFHAEMLHLLHRAGKGSHFVTRDPHDPSPMTQSQTTTKSITTTHESWWVHDYIVSSPSL